MSRHSLQTWRSGSTLSSCEYLKISHSISTGRLAAVKIMACVCCKCQKVFLEKNVTKVVCNCTGYLCEDCDVLQRCCKCHGAVCDRCFSKVEAYICGECDPDHRKSCVNCHSTSSKRVRQSHWRVCACCKQRNSCSTGCMTACSKCQTQNCKLCVHSCSILGTLCSVCSKGVRKLVYG